jgi:hypothetical protein
MVLMAVVLIYLALTYYGRSIALHSPTRYSADGVSFVARFPGATSEQHSVLEWPDGNSGVEWTWKSRGPNGGNEMLVDVYPSTTPLTAEKATAVLEFDGFKPRVQSGKFPSYTWARTCELDDNMGSCGWSGTVIAFDRRAMFELQVWGPAFNEQAIDDVVRSFRTSM